MLRTFTSLETLTTPPPFMLHIVSDVELVPDPDPDPDPDPELELELELVKLGVSRDWESDRMVVLFVLLLLWDIEDEDDPRK